MRSSKSLTQISPKKASIRRQLSENVNKTGHDKASLKNTDKTTVKKSGNVDAKSHKTIAEGLVGSAYQQGKNNFFSKMNNKEFKSTISNWISQHKMIMVTGNRYRY